MDEPSLSPIDSTVDGGQVRRRFRQKTETEQGNITFEALGGNDEFSYMEALRKSSPQLIGFSTTNPRHDLDLDGHAWVSSHWKSSSQK